jgi:hypothetical protein
MADELIGVNGESGRRRPARRILLGAGVALLVLFIVALWSGWISLSLNSNEETVRDGEHETLDLTLSLDRTELREDARETAQDVAGLGDKAEVLAEMESTKGRLRSVDPQSSQLTIVPEGKPPVVVRVNNSTTYETRDGESGGLDALRAGDYVRVVFQTKKKVNWAHEVTITDAPQKDDAT